MDIGVYCSWKTEAAQEQHWARKQSSEAAVGSKAPSEIALGHVENWDPDPTHSPCQLCLPPWWLLFPYKTIPRHCSCHHPDFAFSSSLPSSFQPPLPQLKTHRVEESHTQYFLPLAVPWVPTTDHEPWLNCQLLTLVCESHLPVRLQTLELCALLARLHEAHHGAPDMQLHAWAALIIASYLHLLASHPFVSLE